MAKRVLEAFDGYNKLQDIFQLALKRAAVGKGKIRHATGEPFEQQQICADLRGTDMSAATFQIRKKAKEILRLSKKIDKVNELLDCCVYAGAAVIVLMEEMHKLDVRRTEVKEQIKKEEKKDE